MSDLIEVNVPDIGDYRDVPVIEILVKIGDTVSAEDPLVTLESDKASIDVPAPRAGRIVELKIKVGDKVSRGSSILTLATPDSVSTEESTIAASVSAVRKSEESDRGFAAPTAVPNRPGDLHAELVVLGAGPGGYTAAFRAADLGKKTILIERYSALGGVCLNVGCIPSKALLHVAKVITEAAEIGRAGILYSKPKIELEKLRSWKQAIISKLTKGLTGLAKQRKVEIIQGTGRFVSPNAICVETESGTKTITFEHCIIAAGSSVAKVPGFPYGNPRVIDSTGALELAEVPRRLLIIGGGIIGLEMAAVFDALGSRITMVELMDGLVTGADRDLIKPLEKRITKRYEKILLKTKVAKLETVDNGLRVTFDGQHSGEDIFDYALVAAGRRPNGRDIGAELAGVVVNERGHIPTDNQMRTNIPHIFAIGDIAGEPMLAHKATHEGKVAAEVVAGHKSVFGARTIPAVAYTDPEVAWMGMTETQARAQGLEYDKASFPWAASGRALTADRDEGLTKLLFDRKTGRLIGAGMVGINAGELIAETVLALEMGADAEDLGLTIHPHPTLSETIFFAAEIAEGSITDLYMPKK